MKTIVDSVDRAIVRLLEAAVVLLLGTAAGLGIYQVLTRFMLEQPSTWSEALTRTLVIWMVYLGAALAVRSGLLVSVDVLRKFVGPRAGLLLDIVALGATLLFFATVAWFGYLITDRVRFQNLAGLEISISWAYAALPVGAGLTALVAAIAILCRLRDADRGDPRQRDIGA